MLRTLFALTLSLSLCVGSAGHAADGADGIRGPGNRHLTRIVFSGLAGAVLGLSTLSFYGRPQDRLSNIAVGFAVGIIFGTVSTTYRAVAEPRDFYGLRDRDEPWALMDDPRFARVDVPPVLNYQFTF